MTAEADHFADVGKMVDIGTGVWREVRDLLPMPTLETSIGQLERAGY